MEKKAVDFYWWAEMEKIYCRIVHGYSHKNNYEKTSMPTANMTVLSS